MTHAQTYTRTHVWREEDARARGQRDLSSREARGVKTELESKGEDAVGNAGQSSYSLEEGRRKMKREKREEKREGKGRRKGEKERESVQWK